MLEKQLSTLLATYLNRFIRNLNEERVCVSLWSGNVTLRDLELQPDILDQIYLLLNENSSSQATSSSDEKYQDEPNREKEDAHTRALLLPFTIVKGVIKELVITIPWASLERESISICFNGVQLVTGPIRSKPFDEEEEPHRLEALRKAKIALFEKARLSFPQIPASTKPKTTSDSASGDLPSQTVAHKKAALWPSLSLLERLMETIKRNVHILVNDVVLQYAFDYEGLNPSLASSAVMILKEIEIATTDMTFEKSFVVDPEMPTCKSVKIGSIECFLCAEKKSNSVKEEPKCERSTASCSSSSSSSTISSTSCDENDNPTYNSNNNNNNSNSNNDNHSSLVAFPDSLQSNWVKVERFLNIKHLLIKAKLTSQRLSPDETATVDLCVSCENTVQTSFSFGSLQTAKYLLMSLKNPFCGVEFRKWLPLLQPSSGSTLCASQRWKFVLACVLHRVRLKQDNFRRSGNQNLVERALQFCKDRKVYCFLWKRSRGVEWLPPLDASENQTLNELENNFSPEQLVFLRCLAYAELSVESSSRQLQQQYISRAFSRRVTADDSNKTKSSSSESTAKKGFWGLGWLRGVSEDSSSSTTNGEVSAVDPPKSQVETPIKFYDAFFTEWECAKRFLSNINVAGATASSSSQVSTSKPTVTIFRFILNSFEARLIPRYWTYSSKGSSLRTPPSFLSQIKQEFVCRFESMELFLPYRKELRADKASFSFFIGSAKAYFDGPLFFPLLWSRTPFQNKSPIKNSDPEDFFSLKLSSDQKNIKIATAPIEIWIRPPDEIKWWTEELKAFSWFLSEADSDDLPLNKVTNHAHLSKPITEELPSTPEGSSPLGYFFSSITQLKLDCSDILVVFPTFTHNLSLDALSFPSVFDEFPEVSPLHFTNGKCSASVWERSCIDSKYWERANDSDTLGIVSLSIPAISVDARYYLADSTTSIVPGWDCNISVGISTRVVRLLWQESNTSARVMASFSMIKANIKGSSIAIDISRSVEVTLDISFLSLLEYFLLRDKVLTKRSDHTPIVEHVISQGKSNPLQAPLTSAGDLQGSTPMNSSKLVKRESVSDLLPTTQTLSHYQVCLMYKEYILHHAQSQYGDKGVEPTGAVKGTCVQLALSIGLVRFLPKSREGKDLVTVEMIYTPVESSNKGNSASNAYFKTSETSFPSIENTNPAFSALLHYHSENGLVSLSSNFSDVSVLTHLGLQLMILESGKLKLNPDRAEFTIMRGKFFFSEDTVSVAQVCADFYALFSTAFPRKSTSTNPKEKNFFQLTAKMDRLTFQVPVGVLLHCKSETLPTLEVCLTNTTFDSQQSADDSVMRIFMLVHSVLRIENDDIGSRPIFSPVVVPSTDAEGQIMPMRLTLTATTSTTRETHSSSSAYLSSFSKESPEPTKYSFLVENGNVCVYFPFFYQLISLLSCPAVLGLLSLKEAHKNTTSNSDEISASYVSHAAPPSYSLEGSIQQVGLAIAERSNRPVDLLNDDSHFYIFLPHIQLSTKLVETAAAENEKPKIHKRILVACSSVLYRSPTNARTMSVLFPFIRISIDNAMLLTIREDKTSFHTISENPSDQTIYIEFSGGVSNDDSGSRTFTSATAEKQSIHSSSIDATLSQKQFQMLSCCFFNNILAPAPPCSKIVLKKDSSVLDSSSRLAVLIKMSLVRLNVALDTSKSFLLELEKLQLYVMRDSTKDGTRDTMTQNFQLRGISIRYLQRLMTPIRGNSGDITSDTILSIQKGALILNRTSIAEDNEDPRRRLMRYYTQLHFDEIKFEGMVEPWVLLQYTILSDIQATRSPRTSRQNDDDCQEESLSVSTLPPTIDTGRTTSQIMFSGSNKSTLSESQIYTELSLEASNISVTFRHPKKNTIVAISTFPQGSIATRTSNYGNYYLSVAVNQPPTFTVLGETGDFIHLLYWEKPSVSSLQKSAACYFGVKMETLNIQDSDFYKWGSCFKELPDIRSLGQLECTIRTPRIMLDPFCLSSVADLVVHSAEIFRCVSFPYQRDRRSKPLTTSLSLRVLVTEPRFYIPLGTSASSWCLKFKSITLHRSLTRGQVLSLRPSTARKLFCFALTTNVTFSSTEIECQKIPHPILLSDVSISLKQSQPDSIHAEWAKRETEDEKNEPYNENPYGFLPPYEAASITVMVDELLIQLKAPRGVVISLDHIEEIVSNRFRFQTWISASSSFLSKLSNQNTLKTQQVAISSKMDYFVEMSKTTCSLIKRGSVFDPKEPPASSILLRFTLHDMASVSVIESLEAGKPNASSWFSKLTFRGGWSVSGENGVQLIYCPVSPLKVSTKTNPSTSPPTEDVLRAAKKPIGLECRLNLASSTSALLHPSSAPSTSPQASLHVNGVVLALNAVSLRQSYDLYMAISDIINSFSSPSNSPTIDSPPRNETLGNENNNSTSAENFLKSLTEIKIDFKSAFLSCGEALCEVQQACSYLKLHSLDDPYTLEAERLFIHSTESNMCFGHFKGIFASLGEGNIQIRVKRATLDNYNTLFFLRLQRELTSIQACTAQFVKFSKKKEDSFRQSIMVTLSNVMVRCFRLPEGGSTYTDDTIPCKTVETEPIEERFEVTFPDIIIKSITATRSIRQSLEAENATLRYVLPSKSNADLHRVSHTLLSGFNVSYLLEEDGFKNTRSTSVQLGRMAFRLPTEDTLLTSIAETVSLTLLPLTSLPLKSSSEPKPSPEQGNPTPIVSNSALFTQNAALLLNDSFTFSIPHVSLSLSHNFSANSASASSKVNPPELRGNDMLYLDATGIFFETNKQKSFSSVVFRIASIGSTLDPSFEHEFFSCAPSDNQSDLISTWAVYFEQSEKITERVAEKSTTPPFALPMKEIKVIGKIHSLKLIISPNLINTLNESVFRHLSVGINQARHELSRRADPIYFRELLEARRKSEQLNSDTILVSSDFTIREDLILGEGIGKSRRHLRFVKSEPYKSQANVITVKSVNGARLIMNILSNNEFPIVVEDGLTVKLEDTPLVVFTTPLDSPPHVLLGDRSLFICPNVQIIHTEAARSPTAPFFSSYPASQNQPKAEDQIVARVSPTSDPIGLRTFQCREEIDISTTLDIRIWSTHRVISMLSDARLRYQGLKECIGKSGDVLRVLDESGEVAIPNLTIFSGKGPITSQPVSIVGAVRHQPAKQTDSSGATSVTVIIPHLHLTLSILDLHFLYEIIIKLKKSAGHIGSALDGSPFSSDVVPSENDKSEKKSDKQQSIFLLVSPDYTIHVPEEAPASLIRRAALSVTAPLIELNVTNEFFSPEWRATLENFSLKSDLNCNLSNASCVGVTSFSLCDFPSPNRPRLLIEVSPEWAFEHTRCGGSGTSQNLSIACQDALIVAPIDSLARLRKAQSQYLSDTSFSFQNSIGADVVVYLERFTSSTAEADIHAQNKKSRWTTFICEAGETRQLDLWRRERPRLFISLLRRTNVVPSLPNKGITNSSPDEKSVEVDLETLHKHSICRHSLQGTPTGVLDVVFRLEKSSNIQITSCVRLINDLPGHTLSFTRRDAEAMTIGVNSSAYADFPVLQQPLNLQIEDYSFSVLAPQITLEDLLGAFILLPSDITNLSPTTLPSVFSESRLLPNGALLLPLCLKKKLTPSSERATAKTQMTSQIILYMVLHKQPAKSTTGIPRYEIDIRIKPAFSLLNLSGFQLTLEMLKNPDPSASSTQAENNDIIEKVTLKPQERFTYIPTSTFELTGDPHMMLSMEYPFSDVSSTLRALECIKISPSSAQEWITFLDADRKPSALLRFQCTELSQYTVKSLGYVHNALDFPVCLTGRKRNSIVGLPADGQLLPGQRLPIAFFPFSQTDESVTDAQGIYFTVPTNSFSTLSENYFHLEQNNPCLLTCCGEKESRALLMYTPGLATSAILSGSNDIPLIRIDAVWIIHNHHNLLPLSVRPLGLDAESDALHIAPGGEGKLVRLSPTKVEEPMIQMRYGYKEDTMFEWSMPIKLSDLAACNYPLTVRQRCKEDQMKLFESEESRLSFLASHNMLLFSTLNAPFHCDSEPEAHYYACLSIASRKMGEQQHIEVSLDDNTPVVIENRTKNLIQFTNELSKISGASSFGVGTRLASSPPSKRWAFIAPPQSDAHYCWDYPIESVDTTFTAVMYDSKNRSYSKKIVLHRAYNPRKPEKIFDTMFFLVSYDSQTGRFFVTITEDSSFDVKEASHPQNSTHMELFVRKLSFYVSSTCIPVEETNLRSSPFYSLLRPVCQLNLPTPVSKSRTSDDELLQIMKSQELDIVLFSCAGVYAVWSSNEKKRLGRLDLGALSVIDCTSPRPYYPIVLSLTNTTHSVEPKNSINGNNNNKVNVGLHVRSKPVFSIKVHFSSPQNFPIEERYLKGCAMGRKNSSEKGSNPDAIILLEYVLVECAPIRISLHDTFLFVIRQSLDSGMRSLQLMDADNPQDSSARDQNHAECSVTVSGESLKSNSRSQSEKRCGYYINHFRVSCVSISFSLTRRSDGKYNPFYGTPIDSSFIPSVENARIDIGVVERTNLVQFQSNASEAVMAVLWPIYRKHLFFQLHRVVGSLEVLGNPIALFAGWNRGFRALFHSMLELKIRKGVTSLITEASSSTLHSVGLLSRYGSRAAASLCLDGAWLQEREDESQVALTRGGILWNVASGFMMGIDGAVSQPMEGAKVAGVSGFFTGFAYGIVGLVSRPMFSLLDGVSDAAEFYSRSLEVIQSIPLEVDYNLSGRNFILDTSAPTTPAREKVNATSFTEKEPDMKSNLIDVPQTKNIHNSNWKVPHNPSKSTKLNMLFMTAHGFGDLQKESRMMFSDDPKSAARYLIDQGGIHNFALHSTWQDFCAYTTPEEFFNFSNLAIQHFLSRELSQYLKSLADVDSVRATDTKRFAKFKETYKPLIPKQEAALQERAMKIKSTLGPSSILTYITPEQLFSAFSLEEIRESVSPEVFQQICSLFFKQNAILALHGIFSGLEID